VVMLSMYHLMLSRKWSFFGLLFVYKGF